MKRARLRLAAATGMVSAGTAWAVFVLSSPINLSQLDTSFLGEGNGDLAGASMASVGDVNKDGRDDLIIGASTADVDLDKDGVLEADETDVGKVYIIFGRSSEGATWGNDFSPKDVDIVLTGEKKNDQFGSAVTGLGDVNGDLIDDFAIASPNNGDNGGAAGKVYIIFGKTSGWKSDTGLNAANATFVGEQTESVGYAMSSGGDINRDGINDIVIGSLRYRYVVSASQSYDYAGRVFFVFGKTTGWAKGVKLTGTVPQGGANAWIVGESTNQLVGRAVAGGGDIDGDGYDDVVIGAPGDANGQTNRGQVGIVFGKASGWTQGMRFSQTVGASYLGEADFDLAGQALALLPDATDDGRADVLIGAPGHSPTTSTKGAGKVYLVTGKAKTSFALNTPLANADASWIGEFGGDAAGSALASGGFMNSDPYGELLIGAYKNDATIYNSGKTYVIFGGTSLPKNGKLADAPLQLHGPNEYDNESGLGVVGEIDIDTDGYADLIIGAARTDLSSTVKDAGAVHILRGVLLQDRDSDTYSPLSGDCDDKSGSVYPGAQEVPYDGIDQDCSGADLVDVDGDQYRSTQVGGLDCNDLNAAINPAAVEICDGVDQNCNGAIDDGALNTYYTDQDEDGFGDGTSPVQACTAPAGTVSIAGDCNDANASVNPEGVEIPYDKIDQDCSGADLVDVDSDGQSATQAGGTDCNDDDPYTYLGAQEIAYDGIDQNCDTFDLVDIDADTFIWFGLPEGDDCDDEDPDIYPGAEEIPYDGIDQDCDEEQSDLTDVDGDGQDSTQVSGGTDCNDADPFTYRGATEIAEDGIDQNCDSVDALDLDDDGFTLPDGEDCNDSDATIYPGADEIPYDDIDQDCDDEDLRDVDGDSYEGEEVGGLDCDDESADIYPGADDIPYDGIDQDCSGKDAEDVDGDGFAAGAGGDCDDDNAAVHPGVEEIPGNGVDENCDGLYADQDSDGYDAPEDCKDLNPQVYPGAVELPYDAIDQDCSGADLTDVDGDGHISDRVGGDDCEDNDAVIYPGAVEVAGDGKDNDCDGRVDPTDEDGDGFSVAQGDCDDLDPRVNPGAAEALGDLLDNDCDGREDEQIVKGEQDPGGCTCSSPASPTAGQGWVYGLLLLLPLGALRRRR